MKNMKSMENMENMDLSRKEFLQVSGVAATSLLSSPLLTASTAGSVAASSAPKLPIYTSVKIGMVKIKGTYLDKFKVLKSLGYDGIELNGPNMNDDQIKEAVQASRDLELPIHGTVCSTHWKVRLSDPNPETRKQSVQNIKNTLIVTRKLGGDAMLLVPGRVNKEATQQQVWDYSIEGIKSCLPLASKLGVRILIENVWNGFCYEHNGPGNQSADQLKSYLDTINSPWVGSYFDIGNHQKYGKPADWIRTLGSHIVKLDVKDWGEKGGFSKIGEGDVDWADVRKALAEIGFSGWSTAEVRGGNEERLKEVHDNMKKVFAL